MSHMVIIGAGGAGRGVLDAIEACVAAGADIDVLGFVVDSDYGNPGLLINDKPVLGDFSWLQAHVTEVEVICAIGAPDLRKRLVDRAERIGCRFATVIHPSVILTRHIAMGKGIFIAAGCILTNQIVLGNHVFVNLDCTIGHDDRLADFVTLAPGTHISGNVTLGEGVMVGTGVNIIENISVGEWSIIGAGSTLIHDLPANVTATGLPARVIKQRTPGWHLK